MNNYTNNYIYVKFRQEFGIDILGQILTHKELDMKNLNIYTEEKIKRNKINNFLMNILRTILLLSENFKEAIFTKAIKKLLHEKGLQNISAQNLNDDEDITKNIIINNDDNFDNVLNEFDYFSDITKEEIKKEMLKICKRTIDFILYISRIDAINKLRSKKNHIIETIFINDNIRNDYHKYKSYENIILELRQNELTSHWQNNVTIKSTDNAYIIHQYIIDNFSKFINVTKVLISLIKDNKIKKEQITDDLLENIISTNKIMNSIKILKTNLGILYNPGAIKYLEHDINDNELYKCLQELNIITTTIN